LALPRELREVAEINDLAGSLGKSPCIDFQGVSGTNPKASEATSRWPKRHPASLSPAPWSARLHRSCRSPSARQWDQTGTAPIAHRAACSRSQACAPLLLITRSELARSSEPSGSRFEYPTLQRLARTQRPSGSIGRRLRIRGPLSRTTPLQLC
jgi:hypothetical protein